MYCCVLCVVPSTQFSQTFLFINHTPHTFYLERYNLELEKKDTIQKKSVLDCSHLSSERRMIELEIIVNRIAIFVFIFSLQRLPSVVMRFFKADLFIKGSYRGFPIFILAFVRNGGNLTMDNTNERKLLPKKSEGKNTV